MRRYHTLRYIVRCGGALAPVGCSLDWSKDGRPDAALVGDFVEAGPTDASGVDASQPEVESDAGFLLDASGASMPDGSPEHEADGALINAEEMENDCPADACIGG